MMRLVHSWVSGLCNCRRLADLGTLFLGFPLAIEQLTKGVVAILSHHTHSIVPRASVILVAFWIFANISRTIDSFLVSSIRRVEEGSLQCDFMKAEWLA
jgi:hypothetical protein